MKIKFVFFTMALMLCIGGLSSCKKPGCTNVNACNYDPDAKTDDATCIDKGQVTFWQDSSGLQFDIVVTVNATEASITSSTTTVPACDFSGSATFSLCPGSHNYTAHQVLPGTATWSGNVVAVENGCTTVKLN